VNKIEQPVAILGAGITGLTAAWKLGKNSVPVRVLEADPFIGGASRTEVFNERFRFDLGGHRLYTRNKEVLDVINTLLPGEVISVPRISRIYIRGKFADYPLSFFNALAALGPVTSCGVAASYAWEQFTHLFRTPPERSFEDWVVSRFGRRLYEIYFKPYSEKVWGIPCDELGADFAAQRIKGLSFREAVKNMLFKDRSAPATLASQFHYPRHGFGRIPEAMAATLPAGSIELSAPAVRLEHDGRRITAVAYRKAGREEVLRPSHVIGTAPITDMVHALSPAAPKEVLEAAAGLRYRDMVIIFITLNRPQLTTDHWIYFSTDDVFFGRIHEPKNWSRDMAPADKTGIVVEVFCFETDAVFSEPEDSVTRRTIARLVELKMLRADEVAGSTVIRLKKAYPLYVPDYQRRTRTVFEYMRGFENFQPAGRNGMYRYTSADYYMEMGLRAAGNVMGGHFDLMEIAAEKEYAEK
jgi:protoporphyrinogen oxidase